MSASASLAVTQLVPLAKEVDQNKVTPGILGFIVFAVLALAVWGLMKSMNRHMSRVDFKVPEDDADASGDGTGTTSGTRTGGGTGENGKNSG
jgi:hypothetical protein